MEEEAAIQSDTVEVTTNRCVICGKTGTVTMPREAHEKWRSGQYIQEAWPEGSDEQREQLISGSHSECFDMLFPEDQD